MISWTGCGRKRILGTFPAFAWISWGIMKKTLRQYSRSPGRYLNPGPPEYEAGVPITRPRHSSCLFVLIIVWQITVTLLLLCEVPDERDQSGTFREVARRREVYINVDVYWPCFLSFVTCCVQQTALCPRTVHHVVAVRVRLLNPGFCRQFPPDVCPRSAGRWWHDVWYRVLWTVQQWISQPVGLRIKLNYCSVLCFIESACTNNSVQEKKKLNRCFRCFISASWLKMSPWIKKNIWSYRWS
jgi:hypothetical protein